MEISTNFTTIIEDVDKIMTGEERYPILGDLVTEEEAVKVLRAFKGLNLYWECLPKAEMARIILGRGKVTIGEIRVMGGDYLSAYGHNYNPPYEFHAWLEVGDGIVDFALPGLIEKGLNTSDEIGPYIVEREPTILAGVRLNWMYYKKIEYYKGR